MVLLGTVWDNTISINGNGMCYYHLWADPPTQKKRFKFKINLTILAYIVAYVIKCLISANMVNHSLFIEVATVLVASLVEEFFLFLATD